MPVSIVRIMFMDSGLQLKYMNKEKKFDLKFRRVEILRSEISKK